MHFVRILFFFSISAVFAAPTPATTACTYEGSGGGDTENGVLNKSCCTDVTVVFARGTSETGNVGTVSGPPFLKSLRSKLGANRVTVQGVAYPASYDVSIITCLACIDKSGILI
jgi:cutinase